MPELSGSLRSIELAPLARFLCNLGKSGDLLVSREHWFGQLSVDGGRLTAAAVETETGVAALEFIAVALRGGEFEFSEGEPSLAPNLGPDPIATLESLRESPTPDWLASVPGPSAVPRVIAPESDQDADAELRLSRGALHILLALDGQRSVRNLASQRGLRRVLSGLAQLYQLGLIEFEGVAASGSQLQPPPPTVRPARPTGPSEASQPSLPSRTSGGAAGGPRFGSPLARAFSIGKAFGRNGITRTLVVTALAVLGMRATIQNFRVEGTSMLPNFGAGQVLVVNRLAYWHIERTVLARALPTQRQGSTQFMFGGPARGDVAVFHSPEQPDTDYIKRIVGLPGDLVHIQDGLVYVNDQPIDEPYIKYPATYTFPEGGGSLRVPDMQYFVLGDNRPDSYDSHFGWLVPTTNLVGRAWIRYWPPDEVGVVQPAPAKTGLGLAAQVPVPSGS